MQNPPENGGLATDISRETRRRGSPELPRNQARRQEDSCNGRTHAGRRPPSGRVCVTRRRINVSFSGISSRQTSRREKVFGPGPGIPLDRNAKARIRVYARAYNARTREEGQHTGPVTRAFMDVLRALLYSFHNGRDGRCFPSYERIAAAASCCRSTVYAAIRALEAAGVLTWVNRLTKIRVPERDLFGRSATRWQVIRTSNAYLFQDPQPGVKAACGRKSENPPRPMIQEILSFMPPASSPGSAVSRSADALDSALGRLAKAIGAEIKPMP